MAKWITCGAFENPKKARSFARFSSKENYATEEEAEALADQWRKENRYSYIWVEKVGR